MLYNFTGSQIQIGYRFRGKTGSMHNISNGHQGGAQRHKSIRYKVLQRHKEKKEIQRKERHIEDSMHVD